MNKFTKNLIKDGKYGIAIAFLVLASVYFVQAILADNLEEQIKREFTIISEEVLKEVISEIEVYSNVVSAGQGLYGASKFVDRGEWHDFIMTQSLLYKYPGIQALEYIERVTSINKEEFLLRMKEDGFEDFKVNPDLEKEEYLIVNYIEPFEGNEAAFGFDLSSNPDRLEALEKSRDTDDFVVTSPISLIQDTDMASAFLAMAPIYKNNEPIETINQRRENLLGFSLAVFRSDILFGEVITEIDNTKGIHFSLSDNGEVFFESKDDFNSNEKIGDLKYINVIEVGGRVWNFETKGTDLFLDSFKTQRALPYIVWAVSFVFAILLFAIFLMISRSARHSAELAREMTLNFNKEKEKVEEQARQLEKEKEHTEDKLDETEKLNKIMIDRELKMIELKKEVDDLKNRDSS